MKSYTFENALIAFDDKDNDLFVNATQMAKVFDKRPIDWLRLPSTDAFLDNLEAVRKSHRSDFIRTENGIGTWMHQDVALEFARWLSPKFAIWTNDRIKELLTIGKTEIARNPMEIIAEGYGLAMQEIEKLKRENGNLLEISDKQAKIIEAQSPVFNYAKEVLNSETSWSITTIAKEMGISALALNRELVKRKIQYKQDGHYVLYAKYQNQGYTENATYSQTVHGETRTYISTKWTEKGRHFIHSLFNFKYQITTANYLEYES